jgi:hypothetical protein
MIEASKNPENNKLVSLLTKLNEAEEKLDLFTLDDKSFKELNSNKEDRQFINIKKERKQFLNNKKERKQFIECYHARVLATAQILLELNQYGLTQSNVYKKQFNEEKKASETIVLDAKEAACAESVTLDLDTSQWARMLSNISTYIKAEISAHTINNNPLRGMLAINRWVAICLLSLGLRNLEMARLLNSDLTMWDDDYPSDYLTEFAKLRHKNLFSESVLRDCMREADSIPAAGILKKDVEFSKQVVDNIDYATIRASIDIFVNAKKRAIEKDPKIFSLQFQYTDEIEKQRKDIELNGIQTKKIEISGAYANRLRKIIELLNKNFDKGRFNKIKAIVDYQNELSHFHEYAKPENFPALKEFDDYQVACIKAKSRENSNSTIPSIQVASKIILKLEHTSSKQSLSDDERYSKMPAIYVMLFDKKAYLNKLQFLDKQIEEAEKSAKNNELALFADMIRLSKTELSMLKLVREGFLQRALLQHANTKLHSIISHLDKIKYLDKIILDKKIDFDIDNKKYRGEHKLDDNSLFLLKKLKQTLIDLPGIQPEEYKKIKKHVKRSPNKRKQVLQDFAPEIRKNGQRSFSMLNRQLSDEKRRLAKEAKVSRNRSQEYPVEKNHHSVFSSKNVCAVSENTDTRDYLEDSQQTSSTSYDLFMQTPEKAMLKLLGLEMAEFKPLEEFKGEIPSCKPLSDFKDAIFDFQSQPTVLEDTSIQFEKNKPSFFKRRTVKGAATVKELHTHIPRSMENKPSFFAKPDGSPKNRRKSSEKETQVQKARSTSK